MSPGGTITTFAGTGTAGSSGDGGPATSAELDYPVGLAFDASGRLLISDSGASRVRRVNGAGTISTFAGTGTSGDSGDGGPATAADLASPYGLAVDQAGNVYIADFTNNRVRRVNGAGTIGAFAGTGTAGGGGDGGAATAAQLSSPRGLTIDGSGNLYIADSGNHRVRMVAESFPPDTTIDSVRRGRSTIPPRTSRSLPRKRAPASSAGSTPAPSRPAAHRTPQRSSPTARTPSRCGRSTRRATPTLRPLRAPSPSTRRRPTRRSTLVPRGRPTSRPRASRSPRSRARASSAGSTRTPIRVQLAAHHGPARRRLPHLPGAGHRCGRQQGPDGWLAQLHRRHLDSTHDDRLGALGDDQGFDAEVRLLLLEAGVELRVPGRLGPLRRVQLAAHHGPARRRLPQLPGAGHRRGRQPRPDG